MSAKCWKLTPWSKVLLENLTVTQLVKKFPAFSNPGPGVTFRNKMSFMVRSF